MSSIFSRKFIREETLRDIRAGSITLGHEVDLFLADSRGSHLSCIQDFTVLENGEEVPADDLVFVLRGREMMVSHFPMLAYEYWRIDEDATLRILNGRPAAEVRELTVRFGMRVPFVGTTADPIVAPFDLTVYPGKEA